MGAIGHDGLAVPGSVELAHEPPFRLGILEVEPATRQLKAADRSETIEPRVMQVLVALYRAGGIVTRDELTQRCWAGRVVGDDAINRVLSRLRHIGADIGGGSFSIETITKVGYKLTVDGVGPAAGYGLEASDEKVDGKSRRTFGALIVAGAAVAAAGGPFAWRFLSGLSGPPQGAKELYQRAIALRGSASQEDNRQAIAYLREAVRIAPEYGEAWGALAFAYRGALLGGPSEEVSGFEDRLEEAIRQADRYDPGNADAVFARQLTGLYFGRWAAMEPIYRDLAGRFPKHPSGHQLLGSLLMDVGRWNDAIVALRKAKERNRLAPITRYKLTVSLWSAGRISEAEHEIDESMRWSIHSAVWQTKVKLLAMTGRPQAALAIVNDPSTRPADTGEEQLNRWRLFLAAMISRAPADIDRAVADLVEFAKQDSGAPVPQAFQCAMLGDRQTALAMLDGCYLGIGEWASKRPADPSSNASHPLFQPQARSLWGETRFNGILDGIGLERYWRETGSLPDYRRS
jgi:DNA-binding winged helix-turn-helix (wHTH) protein/tetratricopeptide (TPR) repeat protein